MKTADSEHIDARGRARLLLHACCGPCSMEPVRLLRERGVDPDIYYANSNISPGDEYSRRLDTLRAWADSESLSVHEGPYNPDSWREAVGEPWSRGEFASREDRCRACYRLRFEEAAKWAASQGYESLGTTLSVSPYQYTDVIREELERACESAGVEACFEDYRPYYDDATRRSREAGMYRQNYCGCAISAAEAAEEREQRKVQRAQAKAQWRQEHADELAAEQKALDNRRTERRAYDEKRARQRAILKSLRQNRQS